MSKNTPIYIKIAAASLLSAVFLSSTAQAAVLAIWSADADGSTIDGTWTDSSANTNNIPFVGTENRVAVTGQSFEFAYSFGDAGESTHALTPASGGFFAGFGPSDIPAGQHWQVDVWFNPDSATQQATLFSDGAVQTGYSLNYDNGALRFLLKSGQTALNAPLINISGGTVAAGEWSKASAHIDPNSNTVFLFLNDVQVAASTLTSFGQFTGINHTSIAGFNLFTDGEKIPGGSIYQGVNNDGARYYNYFQGDIASVEVSIIPEPGTYALIAGFAGLAFVMIRRRLA